MQVLSADYTRDDYAETCARSLRDTGFAFLVNAPLDAALLARFYDAWAGYFADDQKYQSPSDPDLPAGYLPFRAVDGRLVDVKESFYYYPHIECAGPLREVTGAVYDSLRRLAETLLERLASAAAPALPAAARSRFTGTPHAGALRIIHYPALDQLPELQERLRGVSEDQVRLGAHQDLNLLTLLPAATLPGLDLMDKHGVWHRVTCDGGAVVVNAGDQLQQASGGYFRSTRHRVRSTVAELSQPRYAAAFFLT